MLGPLRVSSDLVPWPYLDFLLPRSETHYSSATTTLLVQMADFGDRHVVGTMPPQLFLDEFMEMSTPLPVAPKVDFSNVPIGSSIQDMSGAFVRRILQALDAEYSSVLHYR